MAAISMQVPEGRQYFLRFLGRIEVEVDAGEYIRAFTTSFKTGAGDEHLAKNLSFNGSLVEGWFTDPVKEEVSASGNRT